MRYKNLNIKFSSSEAELLYRRFIKYFLPPLVGIFVVIVYAILAHKFSLPKNEIYFILIIALMLSVYLFHKLDGPPIPNEELDSFLNQYLGKRYKLNDDPFFKIQQYIRKDNYPVYESKPILWYYILLRLGAITFAFTWSLNAGFLITPAILILVFINRVFAYYAKITNKDPEMVFCQQGIALRNKGFFAWSEVKKIRYRDTGSSESESTNLDIFFSEPREYSMPDYTINIDGLNISQKDISKLFRSYYGVYPRP